MADDQQSKQPQQPAGTTRRPPAQDDDVVGKAYDGRLMRRLLTYLRPYKLQVGLSALAILLKAASDFAGPFSSPSRSTPTCPPRRPSTSPGSPAISARASPMLGITEIAAHLPRWLLFTFLLELLQTYLMQWTGQKVMFDMRSQIFRHLQLMSPAFFRPQPRRPPRHPRHLRRRRPQRDVHLRRPRHLRRRLRPRLHRRHHAADELVARPAHPLRHPRHPLRHPHLPRQVRDSYRRQRAATARINSFTQEYVSGMSVVQLFNRERRAFDDFSAVNAENKQAWTDAIFAYAWYYPVVELLSSIAIALVIWRGGVAVLHNAAFLAAHPWLQRAPGFFGTVTIGVLIAFIQYAQRFFRPIQDLSEKYNILQAAMAASERVFKLLDTEPTILSPAHPIPGNASGSIEFRNVWFTYQTSSTNSTH